MGMTWARAGCLVLCIDHFLHQWLQRRRRYVLDVGFAAIDRRHLAGVDIDAGDVKPGAREFHGEGQADVAQPGDPHARLPGLNFTAQQLRMVDHFLFTHQMVHEDFSCSFLFGCSC